MHPHTDQPTDAVLIARCRAGDAAAWEAIVERHGRLVVSVARRQGLDADAADDVFQEVFFALLRTLDSLENPQGLVRWLMTTATRIAIRHGRSLRRAASGDALPDLPEEGDTALDRLAGLEDRHRVRLVLATLGDRCRALLMALYARGRTPAYDEIAIELGIPRGSIGPTRARCLAKLVERLETSEASEASEVSEVSEADKADDGGGVAADRGNS